MRLILSVLYLSYILSACFINHVSAGEKEVKHKTLKLSNKKKINLGIGFAAHASCFFVARERGWFEEAGLNLDYRWYPNAMVMAAGLSRGEIDAAYLSLIPVINCFANGRVPLKVVCGLHKYGFSLLANPQKIKTVSDLGKPDVRIGCAREATPLDALLHKIIDKYHFKKKEILKKIRRMPPQKIMLALKTGSIDAGFLPEPYPSMGEASGLKVLLGAGDLWPGMQGSVLVVKEALIKNHPDIVRKLVRITKRAAGRLTNHPGNCAPVVAKGLLLIKKEVIPKSLSPTLFKLNIKPEIILRSLTKRLRCAVSIDTEVIQESIDYLSKLGYVKPFKAEKMVDWNFMR
ncbi:ABC transporter substrate-binding protein [Candidatus Riflebacteria bacterium]